MQIPELQSLPTAFALESPEDPMAYLGAEAAHNLPSFWNFPEMKGDGRTGGPEVGELRSIPDGACQKETNYDPWELAWSGTVGWLERFISANRSTTKGSAGIYGGFKGLGELGAWFGDGTQRGAEGLSSSTKSMPGSAHPQAEC